MELSILNENSTRQYGIKTNVTIMKTSTTSLALTLLLLISYTTKAQVSAFNAATISEYKKTFLTYPFSDPNPIADIAGKIYPYYRFDGFTNQGVQKEWKVIELENDYIKVMILPELGGKIWSAIEKPNGRSFIYDNHVIKFRDIAMRGPWTSGGIESNYGQIGHTPNCSTPVDYTIIKKKDGSASCIIGGLDLLTRTTWRLEINLPKDKAYFTTSSFWYNATPVEQTYYSWMNTGIKVKGNLQFIFPGTHYLGHLGEYSDWPVNKMNGKDMSYYENNDFGGYKSYHVFGRYTDFFGAYWHDDDYGMVRYSSHDDKAGKKIFIWGLSNQGMIWEKLLTDTDGQYAEVQSGRLFNQNVGESSFTPFKQKSFAPANTEIWTEYWYPVMKTQGFVKANEYGALNIKYENGWLKVYFSPVQMISHNLEIKNENKTIYSKQLQLQPLETFKDSIQVKIDNYRLVASLGDNKLVYDSDPLHDKIQRPIQSPEDFDWNTVYGLYLQGKELIDQRMYSQAEEKLNNALQKDHNFPPALIKMSELLYRKMRYSDALALIKRALSIDTYAGAANYYYGLVNVQLGNLMDAKDGFDLASLSSEYRSAAYTELSKLYLKEKNFDQAQLYATKATDYNRFNIPALELKAVIYRYQKNYDKALWVLNIIDLMDPLNHFVRFEKYLWHPSEENKAQFKSLIQNEFPEETYMELASSYFDKGCLAETEKSLAFANDNPLSAYWRAWLQYSQGNSFQSLLEKADYASPQLVFPFRPEMINSLQWAVKNSISWKPRYYLALLYKNLDRTEESKQLLTQAGNASDFAPFYAVRAEIMKDDPKKMIADLEKALTIDPDQWRYHKLLAEQYIKLQEYSKSLIVTASFYEKHSQNYIMGMLYAKTLLLNKQYKKVDVLLSKLEIIPFEGATDGREIFREAKLMQAVEELKNKKYKKALQFIDEGSIWPSNLGVGKPYEDNIDSRLEEWMCYLIYKKLNNKQKAEMSLKKILQFKPQIENGMNNSYYANHTVTVWAMQKLNQKEKAAKWFDTQISQYPDNVILKWCKSILENNPRPSILDKEKDANVRILEELIQLQFD